MLTQQVHDFYIPVMGTAFTIDAPLKVGRYGISSVISIGDDELCEAMREFYAAKHQEPYEPILKHDDDYRARRITAYLNLVHKLLNQQIDSLKRTAFVSGSEITKYFELLADDSPLKQDYEAMIAMPEGQEKILAQDVLRESVKAGQIDVNIMTKLDRLNYGKDGQLLPELFSDALSALRGYATSVLASSIVFSAGFNRRLYAYCSQFDDFFPDATGRIKKKIILKVSDFRSSVIQGRFLAKKGLWVSEHRIESGLNCGGHAFATAGVLLGPILQEFKDNKASLVEDLHQLANKALSNLGRELFPSEPYVRITVQGGLGTHQEHEFVLKYYRIDGTGWATPFLLVPEVTLLDDKMREHLRASGKKDLYLSEVSPLGVPFNTVSGTAGERQKHARVVAKRPGSPCPKGFLVSNTEFSKKPVCTASVFYQKRKIKELDGLDLVASHYKEKFNAIVNKTCLCEDLAAGALLKSTIDNKRSLTPTVCPGPNLAYFSKMASLKEMVGHIYGELSLLNDVYRSNFFLNELRLYINYIEREVRKALPVPTDKQAKYILGFKENLEKGIHYYTELIPQLFNEHIQYRVKMKDDLNALKEDLDKIVQKYVAVFSQKTSTVLVA